MKISIFFAAVAMLFLVGCGEGSSGGAGSDAGKVHGASDNGPMRAPAGSENR